MKKIIAVLLSLVMLLCATAGLAEEATGTGAKVTLGTVSINGAFVLQCGVPEGYTPVPIMATQDQIIAMITSEDPEAPVMMLSIAFDETYSDVERLNDLDDEARALLEATFTEDDPDVEITYGETGYGTELLIARHDTEDLDFISFLTIYQGYFIEFVLMPGQQAADKNLTNDQMQLCVDFLTELDFVPATEGDNTAIEAGIYVAAPREYNEETNELGLALRIPTQVKVADLQELAVGDIIWLGGSDWEVFTIESDETYDYIINDEYYIAPVEGSDTALVVTYNDAVVMEDYSYIIVNPAEDLVFLDDIDPESGEILDEPTRHTFAEFLEIWLAEEGVDPGFDADNTYFTIDENRNLTQIEREYVPWQ